MGSSVFVRAITALLIVCTCGRSADIGGTITVKKRLTRPSVTSSVSLYERGPAVELGRDKDTDPLAAERARVIIYIESAVTGGSPTSSTLKAPVTVQQLNRRFDPDMVAIPAGSSVTFPNMDPIFHNVFSLSIPKAFDLGNYPKGETRTVLFPRAGIVYVSCRLHTNMAGVIVVTPNQWFARADSDGQFRIHDVPPGTYTLVAWHKSAGVIRKEVQVVEGRDTTVNYFVPLEDKPTEATDMSHMKMGE